VFLLQSVWFRAMEVVICHYCCEHFPQHLLSMPWNS